MIQSLEELQEAREKKIPSVGTMNSLYAVRDSLQVNLSEIESEILKKESIIRVQEHDWIGKHIDCFGGIPIDFNGDKMTILNDEEEIKTYSIHPAFIEIYIKYEPKSFNYFFLSYKEYDISPMGGIWCEFIGDDLTKPQYIVDNGGWNFSFIDADTIEFYSPSGLETKNFGKLVFPCSEEWDKLRG